MTDPDTGVAHARTRLAWVRTSLALAVGCAVLARLNFGAIGWWALVPVGAGVLTLGLWLPLVGAASRDVAELDRTRSLRAGAVAASTVLLCLAELAARAAAG